MNIQRKSGEVKRVKSLGEGYDALDILKLILAFIVLLRHAGQIFFSDYSMFRVIVTNTISPMAVPAFFTISGFLFFRKPVNEKRLKCQVYRVLKLYLVWSVIYIPLTIRSYLGGGMSILQMVIKYLQNAIFDGTYYHLWYLPSLVFALMFAYFLFRYFNSKKTFIIAGGFYTIGLLTDTYTFWLGGLQEIANFYRVVFVTTRNGLFFGTIYIVMGKWLADNEEIAKKHRKTIGVILILSVIGMIFESTFLIALHEKTIVNINFMSLPLSVSLVMLTVCIEKKIEKAATFRNMSTVIFCCHPWIIGVISFIKNYIYVSFNPYLQTIIAILITTGFSYGVAIMKDKVKVMRFLI